MLTTKSCVRMLVSSFVSVYAISPVFAWNGFGHMAVAYVAYENLSPHARQRAAELLKLNPYYEQWRKQIAGTARSKASEDEEVFMLAATWPDLIRNDPQYKSDGPDNGTRPGGLEAHRNIGYADHLIHAYWHHFDKPWSSDATKLPGVPEPNALTQMTEFRRVLSSNTAPDEIKSYDLTWILHLVGDLHQPLHCITRFSKEFPEGDYCALKVKLKPPGPDSLHWFWDCALGTEDAPEKVADFAKTLPPADRKRADDLNVHDWIDEGYQLAIEKVYVDPIKSGAGPFLLTESYKQYATELAKQQASLAGQRLAKLLNRELK